MANSKMLRTLAIHAQASTSGDMRAQVATFTVGIPQTERLDVEERQIGPSHPRKGE
jgi:hypothetical protein